MRLTLGGDQLEEIPEDRVNAERDGGGGLLGRRQEVGDAGDDARVGIVLHVPEALSEDLTPSTNENLGRLQGWTSASIGRVGMPLHVGIAQDAEDELGHDGVVFSKN